MLLEVKCRTMGRVADVIEEEKTASLKYVYIIRHN